MEAIRRQNPGKVPIHIVERRAYIWEADDSAFVRREHHICGLLSGTLPLIPQQNVFLGLPLQLFNEEVVCLVRCGAAFLVDDSSAHLIPTSSQAHSFWKQHDSDASSQQVRSLRAQKEASKIFEEKLSSTGSGKSKSNSQEDIKVQKAREALEKRKKREEAKRLKEEERKRKDGVEELELFGDHQDDDEEDEQILIKNDDNKENLNTSSNNESVMKEKEDGSLELPNAESIRSKASSRRTQKTEEEEASNLSYSYLTPGSSRNSEWYQPSVDAAATPSSKVTVYTTLSSASKAGIWTFPSNRGERATCAAFEALHEKGYYMGVGLRFGGDFVVYPGDPLRYHSHFTATVQTSTSSMISTLELIASGRLGTAVKKAHLLCGVSLSQDESSEIDEVEDQRSTIERIQSGQMDRIEGDQNSSSSSWGKVTFYSLTWAGFGT